MKVSTPLIFVSPFSHHRELMHNCCIGEIHRPIVTEDWMIIDEKDVICYLGHKSTYNSEAEKGNGL